ncbi:unnamed protein product [Fusarium graminearum]|nr:unnamed protein product [Fusarium graminearum]CAG1968840.1 unnamed protein product [Fusarium graminearum]
MAGTSVDEAQNYCLKRRTRDGTASAQKQQEALNRVSEYPRREEEETKVGVGKRTAQMWRERGTKRGRERKRERERGTNFDVVQVRVELQKIRDQGTQGACEVSLRPTARTRRLVSGNRAGPIQARPVQSRIMYVGKK